MGGGSTRLIGDSRAKIGEEDFEWRGGAVEVGGRGGRGPGCQLEGHECLLVVGPECSAKFRGLRWITTGGGREGLGGIGVVDEPFVACWWDGGFAQRELYRHLRFECLFAEGVEIPVC